MKDVLEQSLQGKDIVSLIVFILFVCIGALAALLMNLNEAMAKKDFSWRVFIKQNVVATALNIFIGITIVVSEFDNEAALLEITKLTSFLLGATSQFIFKKLCNAFMHKPTLLRQSLSNDI